MQKTMLALGLCALAACGSEDPAPFAAVVETAPLQLDPASDELDDLTILVDYTDADGDLGEGTAEVHDCRADGLVVALPLPPIANEDAVKKGVHIEGTLQLVVSDIGDVAPDPVAPPACAALGIADPVAGEAVFCIRLTDAAGHTGEGDCTPPVAIVQ